MCYGRSCSVPQDVSAIIEQCIQRERLKLDHCFLKKPKDSCISNRFWADLPDAGLLCNKLALTQSSRRQQDSHHLTHPPRLTGMTPSKHMRYPWNIRIFKHPFWIKRTVNGMHTEQLKRIWSPRLVILRDNFRAWRTDPKFGSLLSAVLRREETTANKQSRCIIHHANAHQCHQMNRNEELQLTAF